MRTFLAISTAVAVVAGSATATAAPVYTATQGAQIYIGSPGYQPNSTCTLGFNADGFSFTAAHCGRTGDYVYLVTPNGYLSRPVGVLTRSDRAYMDRNDANYNDWARIDWNDSVRLGPNKFSGDNLVHPSTLRAGEQVCVYGNTTHRTNCGRFMGQLNLLTSADGATADRGDSGGPMWVEGRGLVAVMGTTNQISTSLGLININADFVQGSFPGENSGPVGIRNLGSLIQNWNVLKNRLPQVPSTPETQPAPDGTSGTGNDGTYPDKNPSGSSESDTSGSSDLSPEEIWGIVGGIISLISVLVGLAR